MYRTNGGSKVKTTAAVDTSPIANKKSRKRKILDDSDEDESTSESIPVTNNTTSSNSPSSSAATVSDDLPCSSASLQQSPNVLSTPPKRLTGMCVYIVCAWGFP